MITNKSLCTLLILLIIAISEYSPKAAFADPPIMPTCSSNQLPVMFGTYPNIFWVCEPNTDPTAQQEQALINYAAEFYDQYVIDNGNGCPAGTTPYIAPFQTFAGGYAMAYNCVSGTLQQQLSSLYANGANNFRLGPHATLDGYQFFALQQNVVDAAAQWKSIKFNTPIDKLFCNVSGWFTGNVGKGLAVLGVIILGISALLGKISFKTSCLVLIGVSTIFGAPILANQFSPNGLACFALQTPSNVSTSAPIN